MSRYKFLVMLVFGGAGVGVVTILTGSGKMDEPPKSAAAEHRVHPVETLRVKRCDRYEYRQSYVGEVVARRSSNLGFERIGRLDTIHVREGTRVEKGEILARLNVDRLEETRAELIARKTQAQALLDELIAGPRRQTISASEATVRDLTIQLELLTIKATRREKLYAKAGISQEERDEMVYGVRSIQARLEGARHQLDELQAGTREEKIRGQQSVLKECESRISQNEIELDKSTLKAPYAGTVTVRMADEGEVIADGQPILRLMEDRSPEVWIGVPVRAQKKLEPGHRYPIQVNGKTYKSVVSAVLPDLDTTTRTVTAIFSLEEATIQEIPAHHTARLELTFQVEEQGFWLPMSALIKGIRGLWSCFRIVETQPANISGSMSDNSRIGTVERCEVEVLYSDGDRVYVRGALNEGDLLVRSGPDRIAPGQRVNSLNDSEEGLR